MDAVNDAVYAVTLNTETGEYEFVTEDRTDTISMVVPISFTAGVPFPLASGYAENASSYNETDILSLVRSRSRPRSQTMAVPSRNLSFNMLIILKLWFCEF